MIVHHICERKKETNMGENSICLYVMENSWSCTN